MEPIELRLRRNSMMGKIGALLVGLMMLAGTALAQNAGTLDIVVSAGIEGYVAADKPGVLLIEATSPVLFVGSVETRIGNYRNRVAIEIPADGRKTIEVPFPAPGANATAFVVVFDPDNKEVLKDSIALQSPTDALVVGVLDSPAIERTLRSIRSIPIGLAIEPVGVTFAELDDRLSALPYLVVPSTAAAQLTPGQEAAILDYVENGGRVVLRPEDSTEFDTSELVQLGSVSFAASGSGETILADPAALDDEAWALVLRDVARPGASFATFQGQQDASFQLFDAASSQSDAGIPQLSWLLVGLASYVLVVGPLNLFILRRLRRSEWTWMTVPAISLVTVGLFWLGGPRENTATLIHSSIVVHDGADSQALSGVVLVAGTEGNYRVGFPENWTAFPSEFFGPFGQTASQAATTDFINNRMAISFELSSLGSGAVSANWTPGEAPMAVTLDETDGNLIATVTNSGETELWAWGVVSGANGSRGDGALSPGAEGAITVPPNGDGEIFESPIVQAFFEGGGIFDEREQVVWSLPYAAQTMNIKPTTYLWAFTNDFEIDLEVDGSAQAARGPSLIIVAIDGPAASSVSSQTTGDILAIDGADFVEAGGPQVYIGGAEAVYLSFRVPQGVDTVDLRDNWGGGQGGSTFEIYDWENAVYVELDSLNDIDIAPYRGPAGDLVIGILPTDFGEVVPSSLVMRWDA